MNGILWRGSRWDLHCTVDRGASTELCSVFQNDQRMTDSLEGKNADRGIRSAILAVVRRYTVNS
ncbi:hypothetical protein BU24DRAFT_426519 [Aaosphaeria arxii CBS 175.79]|uniref:Uncharacterized protein n=1 Tax=Aaosphaeria arxii CBS 175.79 TaxID=1450172 RepID=A0A6A5XF10_9PLEO|nr:uncharacterized protein BU24DRAFT_426519 [Aaosphaeria arxii CBS 175.79]KAF2011436.1 hypothetical protein BU24DRAFT_426519 [Aaosphaeria arxii CBS 175.79]